jgi:hypothetical protein
MEIVSTFASLDTLIQLKFMFDGFLWEVLWSCTLSIWNWFLEYCRWSCVSSNSGIIKVGKRKAAVKWHKATNQRFLWMHQSFENYSHTCSVRWPMMFTACLPQHSQNPTRTNRSSGLIRNSYLLNKQIIIYNSCLSLANTQDERFTPSLVIKIKGKTVDIWIRDDNPPRCFQKKISSRSKHIGHAFFKFIYDLKKIQYDFILLNWNREKIQFKRIKSFCSVFKTCMKKYTAVYNPIHFPRFGILLCLEVIFWHFIKISLVQKSSEWWPFSEGWNLHVNKAVLFSGGHVVTRLRHVT